MAKLVTIFGGDGFVGRYIVEALLKQDIRVRVASRNPKSGYALKSQAKLGQIMFVSADITKRQTLPNAIAGSDAVINLVGILAGDFNAIQRDGAGNVAAVAAEANATALIHMSAIGANSASLSNYGRTKGEGEAQVLRYFPDATIIRPSIIFGREDGFINRFASLIRALPVVPVIGGKTRFQPVYVGDVALAAAKVIDDPAAVAGKVIELGGPEIFSMSALNAWIADAIGVNKTFLPVPSFIAATLAKTTGWLPGAPITWDQWLMLQSDNVVTGNNGLIALGIVPTPLRAVADDWLVIYRKHGRFGPVSR